jgi:hypothetical protein
MIEKDRAAEEENNGGKNGKGKKPYCKPSFRYERVFETRALSCGKVSRLQQSCHFRRMNS